MTIFGVSSLLCHTGLPAENDATWDVLARVTSSRASRRARHHYDVRQIGAGALSVPDFELFQIGPLLAEIRPIFEVIAFYHTIIYHQFVQVKFREELYWQGASLYKIGISRGFRVFCAIKQLKIYSKQKTVWIPSPSFHRAIPFEILRGAEL